PTACTRRGGGGQDGRGGRARAHHSAPVSTDRARRAAGEPARLRLTARRWRGLRPHTRTHASLQPHARLAPAPHAPDPLRWPLRARAAAGPPVRTAASSCPLLRPWPCCSPPPQQPEPALLAPLRPVRGANHDTVNRDAIRQQATLPTHHCWCC